MSPGMCKTQPKFAWNITGEKHLLPNTSSYIFSFIPADRANARTPTSNHCAERHVTCVTQQESTASSTKEHNPFLKNNNQLREG